MSQNPQHIAAANLAAMGLRKLNDYGTSGRGGRGGRGGRMSGGSFGRSVGSSDVGGKPVRKRTLERKLKRAKGTNRQVDRETGHAIHDAARFAERSAALKLRMQVAAEGGDVSAIPKKKKKVSDQPPVKKARLLPSADGSEAAPTPESIMASQVDENGERPWDMDEEMRFYEQQLGVRKLKKKKAKKEADGEESDDAELDERALRKLRNELAEDGLGDLFDFVTMLESGGDGTDAPPEEEAGFETFDRADPDNRSDDEAADESTTKSKSVKSSSGTYSLEKQQRILAKEAEIDRKQAEMEAAFEKSMRQMKKRAAKANGKEVVEENAEEAEDDDADDHADDDDLADDDGEDDEDDGEDDELLVSGDEEDPEEEDEEDEEMTDATSAKASRKRQRDDDEEGEEEEDEENADDEEIDDDEAGANEEGVDEEADEDATGAEAPSEEKKAAFDLYGFSAPTPESLLAFRRGERNIMAHAGTNAEAAPAAAAAPAPAPTKYVPPHLRAQLAAAAAAAGSDGSTAASAAANSAKAAALSRQLKGLLNRLTSANLENIALQIQSTLYNQHSKRDVTDALCDCMLSMCTAEADSTSSGYVVGGSSGTLLASAALVVFLHATVGQDIGAHFLEKFVLAFRDLSDPKTPPPPAAAAHALKACSTLISFLTYLYNFDLVGSNLIYELVRKFVDDFRADSLELLLIVLQNCGYQLRKADPASLKEIILLVQSKAKQATAKGGNTVGSIPEGRVAFMLEMIYDLKNNKKRHSGIFESIQPLQNWLQGKLKRKRIAEGGDLQLRFGYKDILDIENVGRWWLVGSAWKGKRAGDAAASAPSEKSATTPAAASARLPVEEGTDSVDLLSLARSQHMNTDLRKSLFLIVMSAVDYMDAYEKICKLNLAPTQARQVIKVLLDCCANEAKYNPYYSYLSLQLCRMDGGKEFKFTLQLALWDLVKEFTDEAIARDMRQQGIRTAAAKEAFIASKNRQSLNLSKLLSLLLRETNGGGLNLNWFKTFNFHALSSLQLLFITSCIKDLLLQADIAHINAIMLRLNTQIFEKPKSATAVSRSEEWILLRDGLDFFLQHHLAQTATAMQASAKTKEAGTMLKQRISMARKAMQGQLSEDWMFKK